MKILHIITSLEMAGAQKILLSVINGMSEYEHIIVNVTGINHFPCSTFRNIKIHNYSIANFASIRKIAKKCDLVHGWMYRSNFIVALLSLTGIKNSIMSIHNGSDNFRIGSVSQSLISLVCSYMSIFVKKTIFVSEHARENHFAYKNPIVIYNPIELGGLNDRILPRSSFTVCVVSRYDPIKNINLTLDILRAFTSIYPACKIIFCGQGLDSDNIKLVRDIDRIGLNGKIVLLGTVDNINHIYSISDVLLHTSTCESFGNVFLESISNGIPFICFDVGVSRLLQSKYSLILKSEKIEAWVRHLIKLTKVNRVDIRKQTIDDFNNIKHKFSFGNLIAMYRKVYSDTVSI